MHSALVCSLTHTRSHATPLAQSPDLFLPAEFSRGALHVSHLSTEVLFTPTGSVLPYDSAHSRKLSSSTQSHLAGKETLDTDNCIPTAKGKG